MPLDYALHRGEADAGSFEIRFAVQPLEGAEQAVCLGHVEACPVVPHEVELFARFCRNTELYYGAFLFAGVFPGIPP